MVMVMVVVGCQEAIQSKNCNDDSLHLPHRPSQLWVGHGCNDADRTRYAGVAKDPGTDPGSARIPIGTSPSGWVELHTESKLGIHWGMGPYSQS
jgi:hypothetical protein